MLAIYLAPVYILLNLYVLRWSYLWIGNYHHLFQSTVFRVILAIVYVLISTTPLTGFFDKKTSFPAQDPQSHQQLFSWDLYVYSDDRAECGHHKTDPQIRFPCILDPFTCCVCDCRSDLHL